MSKDRINKIFLFVLPFVFYGFFAFYDGAIWCDDSKAYVYMYTYIEPLYPLIIHFFRMIIGDANETYLFFVVLFQSLLLAYVITNFVSYIRKYYKTPNFINYLILFIFFSVSLLCKYAAKRGSMYSNCLMTEGITYPLYILFFRYLLDYLNSRETKVLIIAALLSFLLISVRKQMLLSLAMLTIVILYIAIKEKKFKKQIRNWLIIVICIVIGWRILDPLYVGIANGSEKHTGDNRFLNTLVFYVAERDDAKYIKDKEAKEAFLLIYDTCEDNGHLKNTCNEKNLYDRFVHYKDNYDSIQIDVVAPMLRNYCSNNYQTTNSTLEIKVDEFRKEITNSLLPHIFLRLIPVFIVNFLAGFMITVSADHREFIGISIVIYVIYGSLLVFNLKKSSKYINLIALTTISVFVNVLFVSLLIFNQTRYTIYNLPLFYVSLLMMFYNLVSNKNLNR